LIFIGAFRFTTKTKNQLLVIARLILVNYKPENRNLMLLQEPVKYKLPVLERSPLKMPSTKSNYSVFQSPVPHLICCKQKYRGTVLAKDLLHHHKKTVKMLAYLISRKHVPTKRGTMYFGT
jgi:DNA polymerase-3 subunit alpha/error-prone DNA polymerase